MNLLETISTLQDHLETDDLNHEVRRAITDAVKRLTPKVRKPIPQMSQKRRSEISTRKDCREIVLQRDLWCQACIRRQVVMDMTGPPNPSEDVHEIKRRSQGGDYLNPDDCLGVCRPCHQWLHQNPKEAYRLGLLKHGWEA